MKENEPISLFYSYARDDEILRNELNKHLSTLRNSGIIAPWYDRDINAGTEWANEIDHYINTAQIILLLISPDFLASDYCYSIEMSRALERHDSGEARVIPVLLRPVDWHEAPFAKLQVLPRNTQPVTTWRNLDLAFVEIAIQIRSVVNELKAFHFKKHNPDNLKPLRSAVSELITSVAEPQGNIQHKSISQPHSQVVEQFRLWQKKVEELKNIHNMLHEIEWTLAGLVKTIQLIDQELNKKEKKFFKSPFTGSNNRFLKPDLNHIEVMWRQTAPKIDDLEYFAAETMKALEDERFYCDSDIVRGPSWITELFFLQQSFEASIKAHDRKTVGRLSTELLAKCRVHLYRIDKRLLDTLKELDRASDVLLRHTV